ncbi:MAG TPA: EAL domain-containing protein [Candidatus Limnocylindrales bacterium]|nr:EAL domain-containing protein [Candidatus Limnocylindrales bacterium]
MHTTRPDLGVRFSAGRFPTVARVLGDTAAAVAAIGLLGHALRLYSLASWLPGARVLPASSAIVALLLGTALHASATTSATHGSRRSRIALIAASAALVISLAAVAEWIIGMRGGIEQVLFPDGAAIDASAAPGRIALPVAVGYVLASTALLLRARSRRGGLSSTIATLALFVAFVNGAGHLYGSELLTTAGGSVSALPATVALLAITIGIAILPPYASVVERLLDPGPSGLLARRLARALPVIALGGWVGVQAYEQHLLATQQIAALEVVGVSGLVFLLATVATNAVGIVAEERDDARNVRTTLVDAQARLAAAVEQSHEAVVMTDLDGNITFVNPAFERMTGYPAAEVLGRNPRILKSGRQSPAFYKAMWAALTAGLPWVAEMTNRRKDGSLYLEEAVFTPIRDQAGAIGGYVAVKRDVTRERALETTTAALARERALVADTLRRIPSGLTAEATAIAIADQIVSTGRATHAHIILFGASGRADSLAFVAADGTPGPNFSISAERTRQLLERARRGPSIETVRLSSSHPYASTVQALGVRAAAYVPIVVAGDPIGMLIVGAASKDAGTQLAESIAALKEFADLAGLLLEGTIGAHAALAGLRQSIGDALLTRRFSTVFQPIVEIETLEPVGFEALTRFDDLGPPDHVFASAKRLGLGSKLESETLAAAVAAMSELPEGAFVTLNVSPTLILDEHGLDALPSGAARRIVLEITERDLIQDYEDLRERLRRGDALLPIAVDDTGAGAANLNHLVELHAQYLKVDIGLVRNIDSDLSRQAIVAALVAFARQTECEVIAEGVETERERAALHRLGVTLGQGFLFGRPAPATSWRAGHDRKARPHHGTARRGARQPRARALPAA